MLIPHHLPDPSQGGRWRGFPGTRAGTTVTWSPRLGHLPRLLAVALFLVVVFCGAWLCDDAYISFRTADNFVHGYGLTWNVQERVQAYTHPLWLLLFSGSMR